MRSLIAAGAVALSPIAVAAAAQDAKPAETPAKAPAPGVPPLAAFAKLPFMEGPELSPDGTRVAARIAVQGKLRLAIIPIGDMAKTALIDPGNYDLNSWSWVNDQWLVLRAGNMQPVMGDSWYVRRTFRVSADGLKIHALAMPNAGQMADDILWVARDGRPHVLIAEQTSIYPDDLAFWPEIRDWDVSTGRGVRIQGPAVGVMSWYADTAGVVRLGIGYDDASRSYRALYRSAANASFKTIARARKGDSLATLPTLILPQSGKAIAIDDTDGYGAVYDYDLDAMKVGAKLFGSPGYDVDGAIFDPSGTGLLGYSYTDTRSRTKWTDPRLAEIQDEMDKAIPDRWPDIVSWSKDLSVLIVRVGAADTPGGYYIYRPAGGKMSLFAAQHRSWAEALRYGQDDQVHCPRRHRDVGRADPAQGA